MVGWRLYVKTDRIAHISTYCDRWCERCAYTMRCAVFAWDASTAMCGDRCEGLRLALGSGIYEDDEAPSPETVGFASGPSPQEIRQIVHSNGATEEQVGATPIICSAFDYWTRSERWFKCRRDQLRVGADADLIEALAIASHDGLHVYTALRSAVRCNAFHGERDESGSHPIQNHWNGSAKVALIMLSRSESAWRTIAGATNDADAAALMATVSRLRAQATLKFPSAMEYIRPGFDEPWR